MNSNSDLIETLHEHITYEYEEFNEDGKMTGRLTVMWDYENDEIDNFMNNEYRGDLHEMGRKNLMWIEEVKARANWKKGETLTLFTRMKFDGEFFVFWNLDKSIIHWIDVMIEPAGYAVLKHFNHYTSDSSCNPHTVMIRSNSVYNDKCFDNNK